MPYRAMFATIVTATIALLALAMWLWYVAPLVAATGWGTNGGAGGGVATTVSAHGESPELMLRGFVRAVMLASFVLICMVLAVGFAATFREWMRYGLRSGPRQGRRSQTAYVDAWKIAGERMSVKRDEKEQNGEEG